jgi:hypothetical protein
MYANSWINTPLACIMREQREMSVGLQVILVGAENLELISCAVLPGAPIIEQLYHNMNGASNDW